MYMNILVLIRDANEHSLLVKDPPFARCTVVWSGLDSAPLTQVPFCEAGESLSLQKAV